jgi:hypothetical protein
MTIQTSGTAVVMLAGTPRLGRPRHVLVFDGDPVLGEYPLGESADERPGQRLPPGTSGLAIILVMRSIPPQVFDLALRLGTQGAQVPAEALQRTGLFSPGVKPGLDQPGTQAGGNSERMDAHGQGRAQADRVSDAAVLQPVWHRPLGSRRAVCPGQRSAERRARQLLRDQLPVVGDLTGADDAIASDQLHLQAHAVGIAAQGAERTFIDQIDEKLPERELPAWAAPGDLLGRGQLGIQAPPRPGHEPGQTKPVHRPGQLRRPAHGRQVDVTDQSGHQRALQVIRGQPLTSGVLDDLVQHRRVGDLVHGVGAQPGERQVSRHGQPPRFRPVLQARGCGRSGR